MKTKSTQCSSLFEHNSNNENKSLKDYSKNEPSQQSLELLKRYFGHSKFRPFQWEIICNALSKLDQLVIMSTGS